MICSPFSQENENDLKFLRSLLNTAFPKTIGNFYPKLGLLLNLIEPLCGGIIIVGGNGTGKTTLLQEFKKLCELIERPFVELSATVGEEMLFGFWDFEQILMRKKPHFRKGLIDEAEGKFLLIDNFHLLNPAIQRILLTNCDKFCFIATVSREDFNIFITNLDKIGLSAEMEEFRARNERRNLFAEKRAFDFSHELDSSLPEILRASQVCLEQLKFEEGPLSEIVERVQRLGIISLRGEIALYYALRGLSALLLKPRLCKELFSLVEPLVFNHRLVLKRQIFSEGESEKETGELPTKMEVGSGEEEWKTPIHIATINNYYFINNTKFISEDRGSSRRSTFIKGKEEIFPIRNLGNLSFLLKRDDKKGKPSVKMLNRFGSRGRIKRGKLGGVRERLYILGTLCRASLKQLLRGGWKEGELLKIYREDLVYRRIPQPLKTLFLFLVDASGSLGASRRMEFVKGAIASLFEEAYRKRDQVAVIIFREFSAEVLLPPTRSTNLAIKKVREIVTGGYTPLSAGLSKALELIENFRLRNPLNPIYLILLTDGRANIPLKKGEDAFTEALKICQVFNRISTLFGIVIDSESAEGEVRFGLSKELARALGGRYYHLDDAIRSSLGKSGKSFKIFATFY